MHVCMAEGAGQGWSQLLREQGHLLEWPGNCEQRSPSHTQEGVKGPRPLLLADTNVPVVDAKAGTPNGCLIREHACPHRNLWFPAAFRLPIHTAGERGESSSVHSCQKGTARPPPLPVGASCRGSQRFAPAASHLPGTGALWD